MKRLFAVLILIGLFAVGTFFHAEAAEIRILHVNDFHGFAMPYKAFGSNELLGGASYLAAAAERLRAEKPSLFLAAGDMIQGSDWANLFQGRSAIELMNRMGFDAMVVGNHEFDFGQEVLRDRISEARFPVLGANVEGMEPLKPYVIRELDGIRVAIVGLVTEDTPVSTHPKNIAGLRFERPEETISKYLEVLRGKADLIVVLSHLGLHEDRVLAEKVKGIDVIVGGHSHTRLDQPVLGGDTVIVQAWEHGKALGVLDLSVDRGKKVRVSGRLEEIRPVPGQKDEAAERIVRKYQDRADAVLDVVIGEAEIDLDGENVRKRETNLGDLIADIVRAASGAEITMINGGGSGRASGKVPSGFATCTGSSPLTTMSWRYG
jgi:5'-nucleotidase / UDP-sugar diphosphatase